MGCSFGFRRVKSYFVKYKSALYGTKKVTISICILVNLASFERTGPFDMPLVNKWLLLNSFNFSWTKKVLSVMLRGAGLLQLMNGHKVMLAPVLLLVLNFVFKNDLFVSLKFREFLA